MIIRVRKQDSAYFYQLLESYEGLASYSTVSEDKGLPYRDIQLHFSVEQLHVLESVLARIGAEIHLEVVGRGTLNGHDKGGLSGGR